MFHSAGASRPIASSREPFLLANAQGPSYAQRAAVCGNVLREAEALAKRITDITHPIAVNGGSLVRQPEATKRALGELIDEMLEKISFLRNQCGDFLSQERLRWLDEVEGRMKGLKDALRHSRPDFDMGDAVRFLGNVVIGFSALVITLGGLLLQPIRGGELQRM
ncbi:MAG: hypothetical protein EA385_07030 [Salinarimonadaceae bacterium]|nr:MAG: hypothetical protein EA385_07030 [Salinarimonadaceae bacterium]